MKLLTLFLLFAANSYASSDAIINGDNYAEPLHVRIENGTFIAPKRIWINPDRYQHYRVDLEWLASYKDLAGKAGMKQDVIDHLKVQDYFDTNQESLAASLTCDQPFKIREKHALFNTQIPNKKSFRLFKTAAGNSKTSIILLKDTKNCTLTLKDERKESLSFNKQVKIVLTNFPHATSYLDNLADPSVECQKVSNPEKTPLLSVFASIVGPQTSCTYPIQNIENLENKIDGLQGKMTALLGMPLSPEFLAKKDPYAPLDFSHAPKLDAILISYLVFRADFTGFLIARALEYHAKQGTQVRVLLTEPISLYKDKDLFDRMMATSPNIKVQLFRWNNIPGAGEGNKFAEFHRAVHAKLFITLSKDDPRQNKLIHGGRNIHDGFALDQVVNASDKSNPYVNYGPAEIATNDETWASWRDFEFQITDSNFIKAIAKQYLQLWNRDADTNTFRGLYKTYGTKPLNPAASFAIAKHLISVPYQDDHKLEVIYEKLIDSAKSEIQLTSPYLRPPKRVMNALIRAAERGVKIKIITRIDLQGDTADDFLEEVNKFAINKLYQNCELYEYTVKGEILHSKLIVIDRTLSFVSSVNQNHRSYIHDIEDGVLIYSPKYASELTDIIADYRSSTRLVTKKVKTVFFRRLVVNIFKDEF